jgi:uncharacterized protein (TIRG00374 family)
VTQDAGTPAVEPSTTTTTGRQRTSHHNVKSIVGRVAALIVTGVALYIVLPSVTAVIGAWPRLAKLSGLWFFIGVVAEAASFVCTFGIQRVVLRTRGWFAVVVAALTGNTVTSVLPGGDAAGAAVQFRMLATTGINPDAAAGGLTASALLSIGGLLMLPILTLPAVLGGSGVNHRLVTAALIGVAGFIVYVALGILLLETDRPFRLAGRGAQWLWNKLRRHRAPLTGLDDRLLTQRDRIREALGQEWKQILLLVVGRLGFDFLCLLAMIRATGSEPHAWLVLLAYSAAGVIALIPATPGGLGIVEASLSGLLVLAGVSVSKAVLATLAYRLAEYWLPMLAGLVAYWLFRRRYGPVRFTEAPRTPAER